MTLQLQSNPQMIAALADSLMAISWVIQIRKYSHIPDPYYCEDNKCLLLCCHWGWFSSCSVTQSCLTLCDPRLPCPSLPPGVCSNPIWAIESCLLIQWCHPTISSSVTLFSSYLLSFPASESFSRSQLFTSGGQSTRASTSASVLPMNIQGWFPLR